MSTPELRPINSLLPRHAPRVLVPSCHRTVGQHPFHVVGQKYIEAVRLAGCLPIVVPSAHPEELLDWLDIADGILLTGSPSNVHPEHFGEAVHDATLPLDPARDLWTLPLIRHAVKRGLPLLGICRGFQETNVALGGSLHQAVHEQHGLADHRAPDDSQPVNVQYGLAHPVQVHPGGLLSALLDTQHVQVNSLHGQGIARLADGLRIEATAPDGLVEAFSVPQSAGFSLCVQWHPEWQANANPVSMGILKAFGDACRSWRDLHRPPGR
jgi:putative glutamine amidotransferase